MVAVSLAASAPLVPSFAADALLPAIAAESLAWAGSSSSCATSSSVAPTSLASSSGPSYLPAGILAFVAFVAFAVAVRAVYQIALHVTWVFPGSPTPPRINIPVMYWAEDCDSFLCHIALV